MHTQFPGFLFNPYETYIGPKRYLPLRESEQRTPDQRQALAAHKHSRAFMDRLFTKRSVSGNPAHMEHMGPSGEEYRVPGPEFLYTKKPEEREEPTSDHTGPAAGPSAEASSEADVDAADAADAAAPKPDAKGKGKTKEGSQRLAKRAYAKAGAWLPTRPGEPPMFSSIGFFGWKKKDLD